MLESNEIIIDTTFLLPAIGIEVEEEAMNIIPYLRLFKVHYLEVSILEAMWKVLRLIPRDKLRRIEEGLIAIRDTYIAIQPPPKAYIKAYEIYRKGHRDLIDALIYSTANEMNIPLLTIDREFIEFLEREKYNTKIIITPNKLRKIIENKKI